MGAMIKPLVLAAAVAARVGARADGLSDPRSALAHLPAVRHAC